MGWFDRLGKPRKVPHWRQFRDRFFCPCCDLPTLRSRSNFGICTICFWEDDGQDSADADEVRGGPNHDYSLTEARRNFAAHRTMYRPEDRRAFAREMERDAHKVVVIAALRRALQSNSLDDWAAAQQAKAEFDTAILGDAQ